MLSSRAEEGVETTTFGSKPRRGGVARWAGLLTASALSCGHYSNTARRVTRRYTPSHA